MIEPCKTQVKECVKCEWGDVLWHGTRAAAAAGPAVSGVGAEDNAAVGSTAEWSAGEAPACQWLPGGAARPRRPLNHWRHRLSTFSIQCQNVFRLYPTKIIVSYISIPTKTYPVIFFSHVCTYSWLLITSCSSPHFPSTFSALAKACRKGSYQTLPVLLSTEVNQNEIIFKAKSKVLSRYACRIPPRA